MNAAINNFKNRNEVVLDHCSIWLRDDAVLMVSLEEGSQIGFTEARKIMDTIEQLSHLTRRSIVFDIRPAQLDMAARVLITGERFADVKKSVALIVPSFFSQMAANLAFLLDKPSFPIRAFISEKQALRWSRMHSAETAFYLAAGQ